MPRTAGQQKYCSVEGCARPHQSLGYCKGHATRVRRYGEPGSADFRIRKVEHPDAEPNIDLQCKVDGCVRRYWAKSYCPTHYRRWSRYGDPLELRQIVPAAPRKCSRTGCDSPRTAKSMCNVHYQQQYRAQNPPVPGSHRERTRRYILAQYGMTVDDYTKMVAEQEDRCAICRSPHAGHNGGVNYSWCVDHDHKTGRVRGLLCSRCNTAIGLLKDDPSLLQAAIAYLTR